MDMVKVLLRIIPRGLTPVSITNRMPTALTHAKRCTVCEQVESIRYLFNVNFFAAVLCQVFTYKVGCW